MDRSTGVNGALKVITFAEVESKSISFLWRKHVPTGMLTMVIGRPGQGKSMFTSLLAAEVTRAGHTVIFSNREDDPSYVTRPRLEAAGAILERVVMVDFGMLPAGLGTLRKAIRQTGAKLVIIDPVAAHLSVSINNDQQVRKAITPLTKLAEETGCSFLIIHHAKKGMSKKAHPLDAIGGASGGLPGACRAILAFGKTDDQGDDDRMMVGIKCNFAEMPKGIAFKIDSVDLDTGEVGRLVVDQEEVEVDAIDLLANSGLRKGDSIESAPKKAIAAEWLTEMLKSGPQRATSLQTMCQVEGLSWRTIRRAAEDIEVVKQRHGFGPNSYIEWSLPTGHPALKK